MDIVVPLIRSEFYLLRSWLRYCPSPEVKNGTLYLSLDMCWSEEEISDFTRIFECSSFFNIEWEVIFLSCDLDSDESFYLKKIEKDFDVEKFPYGQKSGPNIQFFKTMKLVQREMKSSIRPVFLLEVDAYPLKDGWLNTILSKFSSEIDNSLIVGANYLGQSNMAEAIKSHANGNAIYNLSHKEFPDFLDAWELALKAVIKIDPQVAYDVALLWLLNRRRDEAEMPIETVQFLQYCVDERISFINEIIVNYGGPHENSKDFELDLWGFSDEFPFAQIVHGKTFIKNIFLLRCLYYYNVAERRKMKVNIAIDFLQCDQIDLALFSGGTPMDVLEFLIGNVSRLSKQQTLGVNYFCKKCTGNE